MRRRVRLIPSSISPNSHNIEVLQRKQMEETLDPPNAPLYQEFSIVPVSSFQVPAITRLRRIMWLVLPRTAALKVATMGAERTRPTRNLLTFSIAGPPSWTRSFDNVASVQDYIGTHIAEHRGNSLLCPLGSGSRSSGKCLGATSEDDLGTKNPGG